MRIGADTASLTYFFHGLIDDIRIYHRALTDDEVLRLYREIPFIKDGVVVVVE